MQFADSGKGDFITGVHPPHPFLQFGGLIRIVSVHFMMQVGRQEQTLLLSAFVHSPFQFGQAHTSTIAIDFRLPQDRIRPISKVYGLRVCTVNGEDTWIQFGVPNAFYDANTDTQLLQILRGLMADRLRFAIKERKGKWTYTTLVGDSPTPISPLYVSAKLFYPGPQ